MPRRTALAVLLSALSLAAVPGLAQAEDDGDDPTPARSCETADGTVIETGETHYEFQANGKVLELTCNDGTLCGTTFYDDHPGMPMNYACESWGETSELFQQEQPRARYLGVLTVSRAGTYRVVIRRAAPVLKRVARVAAPIA
jgi:hypothetical protein